MKLIKVKPVYDISDGDIANYFEDFDMREELIKDLPKELEFEVGNHFDIDELADLVSEETGYCVATLTYEEVKMEADPCPN